MKSFSFDPAGASFPDFIKEIDGFLQQGRLDRIVEFGDSLAGNFGIGGTVEAFCTALSHFGGAADVAMNHLILLPVSFGTEMLPNYRTCPDDLYAAAPLPQLLSFLRARRISLSLVAAGLGDSTVVEQFLVFKCNEKIGGGTGKLAEALGADWIVRLSAGLAGEELNNITEPTAKKTCAPAPAATVQAAAPQKMDDNELLNQTLLKLSTLPPEERVLALKSLLDPATSTFSSSFRQKFAATVKSRLQLQDQPGRPTLTTLNPQALPPPPPPPSQQQQQSQQRRASQDSSTTFWSGCIRFLEKQQSFIFRVQFVAVDSQSQLPRVSLENWPHDLNLTGLLDSKKESIQAGLSVGYAFKVNVANADTAIASYLMSKMCQNQNQPLSQSQSQNQNSKASPSHLACFRISQDVLLMLRVLSHEEVQFVGYLIDRRFPKSNLTPAAQAASNAINSLTSAKAPLSTTLSAGMESIAISMRRPSFDTKTATNAPSASANKINPQRQQPPAPALIPAASIPQQKPITTNYLSYPKFVQQQHQQQSPVKIAAISGSTLTTNQLLTDPQAILQKLRTVVPRAHASPGLDSIQPSNQPNEPAKSAAAAAAAAAEDQEQLDQSFLDAWLN